MRRLPPKSSVLDSMRIESHSTSTSPFERRLRNGVDEFAAAVDGAGPRFLQPVVPHRRYVRVVDEHQAGFESQTFALQFDHGAILAEKSADERPEHRFQQTEPGAV